MPNRQITSVTNNVRNICFNACLGVVGGWSTYFDLPVPRVKVLTLVDIVVVVVVVVAVYKCLMTVVSTYQFICLDRRINSFL